MKKDYEHVSILIDRSYSMNPIKQEVISGFNKFIKEQREVPGEMSVTLMTFATRGDRTIVYDTVKLDQVANLTEESYQPNGNTALNDSFADLINITGKKLAALPEEDRPEKVLLVCITDGEENDSHEIDTAGLKKMIEHQTRNYKWEFIYLGANQDSFLEAKARSMAHSRNFMANAAGVDEMYASLSASNTRYRSGGNI